MGSESQNLHRIRHRHFSNWFLAFYFAFNLVFFLNVDAKEAQIPSSQSAFSFIHKGTPEVISFHFILFIFFFHFFSVISIHTPLGFVLNAH